MIAASVMIDKQILFPPWPVFSNTSFIQPHLYSRPMSTKYKAQPACHPVQHEQGKIIPQIHSRAKKAKKEQKKD